MMHALMNRLGLTVAFGAALCAVAADQPETSLRSVVNGVTMQSAPANVAHGGILSVFGTGLAAAHTKPEASPLPLALEDPAVEVLVNGVAAPLFFVSPNQINAQVPWEIETGWAQVVVRRGGVDGPAMPVIITAANPNLFSLDGTSSLIVQSGGGDGGMSLAMDGPAPAADSAAVGAVAPGELVSVFAAGLGQADPPVASGALGAGSAPVSAQRAYLGGIPLEISSSEFSAEEVGVYKLTFKMPESAGFGEVLNWYSGNSGGRGILGSVGPPTPSYMAVPAELESPRRIDMSELNPSFVAVSGALDELEFCYSNVQLLDFRRNSATTLEHCLLPSHPFAPNAGQYRPFEVSLNTPGLAGLALPSGDVGDAATDQMVLIDSGVGSTAQLISLGALVDRLLPGGAATGSPMMRLLQTGSGTVYSLVDSAGNQAGESQGWAPIPNPPEVEGLPVILGQGANLPGPGGYRIRILGPGPEAELGQPTAVVFDRNAKVIGQAEFPDGWDPISPPRRLNNQGVEQGTSMAAGTTGFRGDASVFVVARAADGLGDAIVSITPSLPEDPAAELLESIPVAVSVTAFPDGVHAATCHPNVRWQRIGLTSNIALIATSQVLNEFARPQMNQICAGDQLVLFDTVTASIKSVQAPGLLDNSAKGAVLSYLYFADGGRAVALEAPQKLYVFDGVEESFKTIEFPEDVGISVASTPQVQRMGSSGRIVALATGGPPRPANRNGITPPPFPGNRGLLVVDLPNATFTHLALPEGFQRLVPGPNSLFQQGRRTFGVVPLIGRGFAIARQPNAGPGNPGGSRIITWDVATGEATELAMPEEGFAVVQRIGGGGQAGARPYLWDYRPKSATFAYGVYNRGGDMIAIGVVRP